MAKQKTKRRKRLFRREVILEKIAEIGEVALESLLDSVWVGLQITSAMLEPYHESYRQIKNIPYQTSPISIDLKSKVAFWSMISKLKKEGLVSQDEKGRLKITGAGEEYLKEKSPVPYWFKSYETNPNPDKDTLILIVFDVPEKERIKRDWLRYQISALGFQKLQESVWWGTNTLPRSFIDDLKDYEIFSYTHIFSVNKKGTISAFFKTIGRTDLVD